MAAGEKTLAELRLLAQQESDMVNNPFVSDAEWTSYINQSRSELYDILVQKYGDDYFADQASITGDGTTELFPLPADFYKLLVVEKKVGASAWMPLKRFDLTERARVTSLHGQPWGYRYRLSAKNLWISRTPDAGQVFRIWYVPRLSPLVLDTDVNDGVSGWDEFIIVDAAIKAKDKEESDVTVLMLRKQALIQRIEAAAENRDAGQPMTVVDKRAGVCLEPYEYEDFV